MMLYTALNVGLEMPTALAMPVSMLEDLIATWQLMECGYERVAVTEQEQEDEFLRAMSWR